MQNHIIKTICRDLRVVIEEIKHNNDAWAVKGLSETGDHEKAEFHGPRAKIRAIEYAMFKYRPK